MDTMELKHVNRHVVEKPFEDRGSSDDSDDPTVAIPSRDKEDMERMGKAQQFRVFQSTLMACIVSDDMYRETLACQRTWPLSLWPWGHGKSC